MTAAYVSATATISWHVTLAQVGTFWHDRHRTGIGWHDMETSEISLHQLRIFECVRDANGWVSIKEIAATTGSARKTVDIHCRRFVNLGIFDLIEVWPGHRYRVAEMAEKRNAAIMERLRKAREAFGIE